MTTELVCTRCGGAWTGEGRATAYGRRACEDCMAALFDEHARERFDELCRRHQRLWGWSFDTFERIAKDDAGRVALDTARRWADFDPATVEMEEASANVYLYGPVGAGKTGLAWSMLRHRMLEWDVAGDLVNVRDILASARDYYSNGGDDPLNGLDRIEYLVLDDLGAERPTPWALETIATLVDRRCADIQKTTIVTSNYSPSQLIRPFDPKDPIVGQRIVSRLLQDCTIIKVDGPDRRVTRAVA